MRVKPSDMPCVMKLLPILIVCWCVVIIVSLPVHNDTSTDRQDEDMEAEVFQKSNITSKSGECRGKGKSRRGSRCCGVVYGGMNPPSSGSGNGVAVTVGVSG